MTDLPRRVRRLSTEGGIAMGYMFLPLKRYADFSGRSRDLEFWLWALFNMIGVMGVSSPSSHSRSDSSLSDIATRAAAASANYVPPDGVNSTISVNGEMVPPEVLMQAILTSFGIPALLLGL